MRVHYQPVMATPRTVLIIDDEPHVRTFIRLLLKQMGVPAFFEASNGREGVELYQLHRPDFVLMDINMPVMDGLETLRLIQEFDEEALCVMMTAEATRNAVEASGRLGALQFIRKDTPKEQIKGILEELFAEFFGEDPEGETA